MDGGFRKIAVFVLLWCFHNEQADAFSTLSSKLRPHRFAVPHPTFKRNSEIRSNYWEGDDIRWEAKLRRRLIRRRDLPAARTTLLTLNIVVFLYQVVNAVADIRFQHPAYWPREAVSIVSDVLFGGSITGPFTMDFCHSYATSCRQPHRFLTAGFLHGSLLHLVLNMRALLQVPAWLEKGLGWPLYTTTYLVSIVVSFMSHRQSSLCLGASGGICGLYGLLLSSFQKMNNTAGSSAVVTNMLILVLYGMLFDNISNAAHVGGFLGGLAVGYLCGPSYRKSYSMRRKNSLDVDTVPSGYRRAMGFGVMPTRGIVPIRLVWAVALILGLSTPKFRSMPKYILQGLTKPGSLSILRYYR